MFFDFNDFSFFLVSFISKIKLCKTVAHFLFAILDKDSNISLNVLSGEVSIDYTDLENNIQTLREVVVSLNIEIISNKGKLNKKVSLDHTLGDKQNGYSGMMTNEDISKLRIKTINQLIVEIIEREIFNELKEIK